MQASLLKETSDAPRLSYKYSVIHVKTSPFEDVRGLSATSTSYLGIEGCFSYHGSGVGVLSGFQVEKYIVPSDEHFVGRSQYVPWFLHQSSQNPPMLVIGFTLSWTKYESSR